MQRTVSLTEVSNQAIEIAMQLPQEGACLYGIPRGGIPAVYAVLNAATMMGKNVRLTDDLFHATHIIDDIYDSGQTMRRHMAKVHDSVIGYCLFDKRDAKWAGQWLVMPWEATSEGSAEDIVTRLFQFIGEDPNREGLQETPKRFLKAWKEWASGYGQNPAEVLKTFEDGADGCDEMVIVHNIPVVSKCEHHLADINGIAHVGYIPDGKIVGLSKLARLTEVFSRRLQVQERLTNQVADALEKHLKPKGVGVVIRASHACMSSRGVKIHGSVTTTSAMRGALRDKPEARSEFLDLCRDAENGKV